jgi:hypothetical protein
MTSDPTHLTAPAEMGSVPNFVAFLAMAIAWLAGAYVVGRMLDGLPFGVVVLAVFVFAVPIALAGAYTSAVDQARRLHYYHASGWVYRIFSRRILRTMLWVLWAVASAFVMLLQFATYSGIEWLALAATIPVFWFVYSRSRRLLAGELRKRYVLTSFSIVWARRLCPLAMLALYGALLWALGGVQGYGSLAEALAEKRAGIPAEAGSHAVQAGLRMMALASGTQSYVAAALGQLGEHLPLLLAIVGGYVVFFNACATFSCFVIGAAELRRIFAPLSDDDVAPALPARRVAIAAALVTFVALFVFLPLFGQLEESARRTPGLITSIEKVEREVERIDDALYARGTIQEIEAARAAALGRIDLSRARLEVEIDRAFDRMAQNVDRYLDWYYSLSAEYTRLAMLMVGGIEGYVETKLAEHLQQGEPFQALSEAIDRAIATEQAVMQEYREAANEILARNRLAADTADATVVTYMSLDDILAVPVQVDFVSLNARAAGGAVAAGVSAAVTAKAASKGVFNAAAKALSKVAISKGGGTLAAGAMGAAVGSVVAPGVGTAIGGALGVLGGLAAGVLVDGALLKLEELISRDEFRQNLLESIEEARAEFKVRLLGAR